MHIVQEFSMVIFKKISILECLVLVFKQSKYEYCHKKPLVSL